ncbi:hypothetical protein Hanom_Chr14g01282441 [Helianthus anomalus]
MREWYNSRNTKITDGEVLKKRDHDSEDPGNPDPSATSEQPPSTTSTQIVVTLKAPWLALHPVTGEVLEEGKFVADLSNEQMLALNEMKTVEDSVIDQMPIEPETVDTENIDEIVFEGETSKSTYVRADGMEFDTFDE